MRQKVCVCIKAFIMMSPLSSACGPWDLGIKCYYISLWKQKCGSQQKFILKVDNGKMKVNTKYNSYIELI